MIIIRMSRGGSKSRPFYRIVVADQRFPRDGRIIASVGFFNPIAPKDKPAERLRIDDKTVALWVSRGAQLSDRVRSLLKTYTAAQETQPAAV